MIDKLAKLPLLYQPGTRWVYSISVDIQGYLVEKLSGKSLPDFMRERIFEPLGMKDTGFYVPKEKMDRLATLYRVSDKNEWTPASPENDLAPDLSKPPTMPSGGGGLLSTAQDYLRFAQMLLNGGQLDGVRLLAPPTVKLMTSNHLPEKLMTGEFGVGSSTSGQAWVLASMSRCLAIPRKQWTSRVKALFSGTGLPAPGSGSIRPMT